MKITTFNILIETILMQIGSVFRLCNDSTCMVYLEKNEDKVNLKDIFVLKNPFEHQVEHCF